MGGRRRFYLSTWFHVVAASIAKVGVAAFARYKSLFSANLFTVGAPQTISMKPVAL